MKARNLLLAFAFGASCTLFGASAVAQEKKAEPAKPAAAAPAKPAEKPAEKPAAPAAKAGDKPAAAPAGGMDPAMAAMMGPGEFHAKLKGLEGNWDAAVKSSMGGGPMTESKGATTAKWIMDGRYLQEDHTGDFGGMPFKGMGITGYDNFTKKYVSSWIDNFGTGIMSSTGTVDATGKIFTLEGEGFSPEAGKVVKMKMVTKIIDDKKHTFEMYGPGPDGKEFKSLEITYTKK